MAEIFLSRFFKKPYFPELNLDKSRELIHVKNYWERNIFGKGITIAVIDTGCQIDHVALKDRIIGGYNFITDEGGIQDYRDYNGHGTHVAGIIASSHSSMAKGIAPLTSLLILKTLNKSGTGKFKDLISAIHYAVNWRGPNNQQVRIISMSLGTPINNTELHNAIKYAINNGISVVSAASNSGDGDFKSTETHYPGAYNEVIQVGSIDNNLDLAYFSNTNNQIDLVAPGVEILSTSLDNNFTNLSGTSMSAPFVSGGIALILEEKEKIANRRLSECEIYAQLIKKTKSKNLEFKAFGNGYLDLSL